MFEYDDKESNRRLAKRLRREARRTRPGFSTALHERVVSAIWPRPTIVSACGREPRQTLRGRVMSWAVAVASLAAVVSLGVLLRGTQPAGRDVVRLNDAGAGRIASSQHAREQSESSRGETVRDNDIDAAAEALAQSAAGVSDWVKAAADENQWAGLDRDGQRAIAAVAGAMPFDLKFLIADGSK